MFTNCSSIASVLRVGTLPLMLIGALIVLLLQAQPSYAQGCIVSRSNSLGPGPQAAGGYMAPGDWDIAIGFRHQYSFRHFVGDIEQKQRMQIGNQVMNKLNLVNLNVTYQATPRFSFSVNAPLVLSSRRSNNSPYTTSAQGLGDVIVSAQGWIRKPSGESSGNVAFGFGVMVPTGKDNVVNRVDAYDGRGPRDIILDYSVQPGGGGYGLLFQMQSFRNLGNSTQMYLTGSYIATPQNTNNFLRTTTSANPNPLTAYNSISDQYLVQAGVARAIGRVRGLTLTFGPRWEGVPAKDLIGESLGFRRPGYAISLEPGFQYTRGMSLFSFSVAKAIRRDRTRSVPDRITGGHGDAAFADYVWLASYSFRFGGRRASMQHDMGNNGNNGNIKN